MTQIQSLAAFSPEALGELVLWIQPFFLDTGGSGSLGQAAGAFSAFLSVDQTIPSDSAFHKITFDSEDFDVSGWFDDSTANKGRFTPQQEGVYDFNILFSVADPGASHGWVVRLYKNGSAVKDILKVGSTGINTLVSSGVLVEANGTTDYFELFVLQTSGGNLSVFSGSAETSFQGFLVGIT